MRHSSRTNRGAGLPGRKKISLVSVALAGAAALALAGCSSPQQAAQDGPAYKVGVVTSETGALASYGKQYLDGFKAGLAYATNGTNKVGTHPIEVTYADDAGDAAKATAAVTDLVGKGNTIIAGSVVSGIAVQVAELAAQNKVLFVSGPAASDAITGANKYTFRSGRQSIQDVMATKSVIAAPSVAKVVVFAQDTAFGQGYVGAVQLLAPQATVVPVLVPATETEFSTYAKKTFDEDADAVVVAWAGDGSAMWQALDTQGVLDATTVVTGLGDRVTWPALGTVATKLSFLVHYFDGASDTPASQALKTSLNGAPLDLFHGDGFTAAQMIVHALEAGEGVDAQIAALENWKFEGVKGGYEIRAADHALLQPMYRAKLTGTAPNFEAELIAAVPAADVAPPATPFK
jgi:branched-chain amino acid transport system substrate-binding protein